MVRYDRLKAGHVYRDVPIPRLPRRGQLKQDDTSHLSLHKALVSLNRSEVLVVEDVERAAVTRVIACVRGEREEMMFITRRLSPSKIGIWRIS